MTYLDLYKLPDQASFIYQGKKAKKVWGDHTNILVVKSWWNPKKNREEPDVYFKSWQVYFSVEGLRQGITLTFIFPDVEFPAYLGVDRA